MSALRNGSLPALPVSGEQYTDCWGMTKREAIATAVLAGLVGNTDIAIHAHWACVYADALLAELAKV